jgi:hypothetical protein
MLQSAGILIMLLCNKVRVTLHRFFVHCSSKRLLPTVIWPAARKPNHGPGNGLKMARHGLFI